ncbi:U3 small nucleolar RNA-associated protein 14 homolog A isoform X4 [Motacilla alba alba]|uniref:U3 small nucleolar RNA-associated protein 14 homolog A isoform X2 n=1 Tax=Motacilla alba alba TaxID=1094192 RepID=UPI0018D528D1|nr:U3 small nucleolar RNA-associated protein 14 homolog A isoform X2 [Motacilla alba alba]XP_037978649.1 U3 small nucleolar RNA-associated protein 14 homolog A isoform X3 [Motacilla alba alba]XP_037978650.1 U3 small nucleolar RNA-associated protein 14 homolog A isoform X4 [Motacilla alba alba]
MAERDPAAAAAGSGSESDEGEDGERRHRQLLEAISALSGRKRRKLAERSEASGQVSEFNVTCKGAGEKLVLSELLQPVHPKSTLGSVRKELARVKRKAAVELPLSKEEAKRVVREAAYVSTSKDVGKWQQVVLQNRRAEQLVFPLRQDIATVTPLERVTSAWKARTPLEQEIFGLLHKTQQPVTDPLLTPEEMASVQAMSLEEARRRRAELQKARAVQSYYEAKARRAKRIKSKKYHRVLKKSRRRQALKEFEQLHKSDPAAALARLEELEQLRMQERMSLKHQNKGKWARSRAIMAKYDLEARKAMQEQLARNKELMQKVRVEPPEEELCEVPEEDTTALPMPSGANPWMLGKPSGLAPEPEAQEGPRDDPVPGAVENKDEMEEEEEELSEEEALLQDFEQKRRERTGSPERHGRDHGEELEAQSWVGWECWGLDKGRGIWGQILADFTQLSLLSALWSDYFYAQHVGAGETETGAVELGDSPAPPVYAEELGDSPAPPVCAEELGDSPAPPVCAEELVSAGPEPPPQAQEQLLLSEQLRRVQTMEEVESLAKEELVEEQEKLVALRAGKRAQQQEEGRAGDRHTKKAPAKRKMISLEAVLDGKPQEMDCPSLPVVLEEEEGGIEQRGMITEAFAGDDVVADFRREKRKAEEAGKPQVVNLVLPGWGEWGGTGLKPSARKVKRFLIKPPPAPPRKDQHMPHVIMSEKRNIHAAAHQVSELPFPFERHQQFEQSMRTPVGATWNTQRAFQKLTAPRVITRTGHIIQPISAEDVPDTAPGSGARLGGEAMPARKAVPGKKAVSRGKAVPGKKAVSRGKAVPGKKAVSMGKAVPGDKAVSRGKVVPGKKAVPGEKAVSRGKAVPGEKAQPQHCRAR